MNGHSETAFYHNPLRTEMWSFVALRKYILQLKGRFFLLPANPVEEPDHPGPMNEQVNHLVLSGKIHEGKADENGYDPLARQDQHGPAGEKGGRRCFC